MTMKFKIGDTVYTRKRGKGKIVDTTLPQNAERPFMVEFYSCSGILGWKQPKLSNLIPTEAKYKEEIKPAYNVKSISAPYSPVREGWAKLAEAFGKAATAMEVAARLQKLAKDMKQFPSGGIIGGTGIVYDRFHEAILGIPRGTYFYETVPCHTKEELKFVDFVHPGGKVKIAGCDEIKVNDAVLYRGKKWMVKNVNVDYVLRRSDHMGGYKAVVSREDISLWKEPCHIKTDTGKLEFVDSKPDADGKRYRCSKFGVGEKVLYCCQTALVTKITYKDDRFYYDLNSNSFPDNIGEESLFAWNTPKFKVGDVVFYNGEKWEVVSGYTNSKDFDYCISRGLDHMNVKESDLRLWKETKITHDDRMEILSMTYAASDFKSLKYVGTHLNGFDIFSQDAGNGKVVVWYGIKGDDIQ